jgi:hypothetical protein
MRIERLDSETWAAALPERGFEVFHTPAALSVLERHAPGECYLLGGYRGEQLVAMVPLFVRHVAGLRIVSSPPPGMGVPNLGPLVMPTSPKQRKREKVNREFTESLLDTLDADSPRTLVRMLCPPDYTDPRPYRWNGLSVDPSFTYRLAVDDPDDLIDSFSRSLRREIRSGMDLDLTVETAGVTGGERVFEETAARYAEQSESFGPTWPYVRDLIEELGERCRVYVARADGEYLGGVIALFSNDAAYYWLGGTRTTHEDVSINSLLHWRIINDIAENPPIDSVREYDLVGANTEHLCRYKSKFGGELTPYYVVESGGLAMDIAKEGYQLANRALDRVGIR